MNDRQPTIPARKRATFARSHAVRLDMYDYKSEADVHLIICADHGQPFIDQALARTVAEAVENTSRRLGFRLYGFCLMPDHLHVLLSPTVESRASVADWLQSFKGYTSASHRKRGGTLPLWQRSAYDHVCRREETAERVLAYIIENPVRAGLVERWSD